MADFGTVQLPDNVNPLLTYARFTAGNLANQTAQQNLTDRATLRDQAAGFASNDPDVQRQAAGTALSLPGVGGVASSSGLDAMHADARAQLDHQLSVGATLATVIDGMPDDLKEQTYQDFLPIMRRTGANPPDQYPGPERIKAFANLGFDPKARLEFYGRLPVGSGTAPEDPFAVPRRGAAATGGAATVDQLNSMLWGQESGGAAMAPTSPKGAIGGHQIMPGTFAKYALPGEQIDNPTDNAVVGKRFVTDLANRYGGDPARVAVGYFSGEDNVAPPGSPTPWIVDKNDGKTSTSTYVAQALARLHGTPIPPAAPAASPSVPAPVASAPAPLQATADTGTFDTGAAPVQVATAAGTPGMLATATDASPAPPQQGVMDELARRAAPPPVPDPNGLLSLAAGGGGPPAAAAPPPAPVAPAAAAPVPPVARPSAAPQEEFLIDRFTRLPRLVPGKPGWGYSARTGLPMLLPNAPPDIEIKTQGNKAIPFDKNTGQQFGQSTDIPDDRRLIRSEEGPNVVIRNADGKTVSSTPVGAYKAFADDYAADRKELPAIADAGAQAQASKIALLKARELAATLRTGATGSTRAAWANIAETAGFHGVAQALIGNANGGDASAAAEFNKLMTQAATMQEKGTLGSRGGFQSTKIFLGANPGPDVPEVANKHILNMQLIEKQLNADYAREAVAYANQQGDAFKATDKYKNLPHFDQEWQAQRNPEVGAAAMAALNGQPFEKWSKGLSAAEGTRVGQLIARADPNATIPGRGGGVLPASKFLQGQ